MLNFFPVHVTDFAQTSLLFHLPCQHDWCPQICADVISNDAVDVDEDKVSKEWIERLKSFIDSGESNSGDDGGENEGLNADNEFDDTKLGELVAAAAAVAANSATKSHELLDSTIDKLTKFISDEQSVKQRHWILDLFLDRLLMDCGFDVGSCWLPMSIKSKC